MKERSRRSHTTPARVPGRKEPSEHKKGKREHSDEGGQGTGRQVVRLKRHNREPRPVLPADEAKRNRRVQAAQRRKAQTDQRDTPPPGNEK